MAADATKVSVDASADGVDACSHDVALVDAVPQYFETCVNVDSICPRCGQIVCTTSWTLEGWHDELKKERRARRRR